MEEKRKTFKDSFLDQLWGILQHILPAKAYISLKYKVVFKKKINWSAPSSFNEKLQWLKLYGFRPEYTKMVDKITAKEYVKEIIGEGYIIPTLKVWDRPEDIDFNCLPDKFVLKCNHNSGVVLVCTDKKNFDQVNSRKVMARLLKDNYYLMGRETPYKYVKRKIFAEQFIEMPDNSELVDYKFFCFDGVPKFLKINFNKNIEFHANYYDLDMNLLPFGERYPSPDPTKAFAAPTNFEEMIKLSSKLSEGLPFCRVDLYNIDGQIFFGELTLYPTSGFGPFTSDEWDLRLGEMIKLPTKS